jgi:hypothetical protein
MLKCFCGCLFLQLTCVAMGRVFFYRTRVQFPHKLLDFQCLNFDVFVVTQLACEVWNT